MLKYTWKASNRKPYEQTTLVYDCIKFPISLIVNTLDNELKYIVEVRGVFECSLEAWDSLLEDISELLELV